MELGIKIVILAVVGIIVVAISLMMINKYVIKPILRINKTVGVPSSWGLG